MNKRGKVITSLSFVLILILVGSILFVSSQSNESNNPIDETQLTDEEQRDHGYNDLEAMLESHRKYYGDRVTRETLVKIILFKLKYL